MRRILTRVCVQCRRRKPLPEFWQDADPTRRYSIRCHACHPVKRRRTKRCRSCGQRKYLSQFTTHNCSKDGLEYRCKSCIRKYNRKRYRKAGGRCLDCGALTHFRRCARCRLTRQRLAEALLESPTASLTICTLPTWHGRCGEALSFGTDFLGRTTTWCVIHGEHLMPTSGVRHYDQRVVLTDEIEGSVARASKAPKVQGTSAHRNGMHWRQRTNEYLTRGVA